MLITAYEKLVDEYRRQHPEWKHEGGKSPRSCTHKGITTEQGKTRLVPLQRTTVAPFVEAQDIRLDQFKLRDLKGVPQEQVKPMVEAIAKEIAGLCQNGVFQFMHQVP